MGTASAIIPGGTTFMEPYVNLPAQPELVMAGEAMKTAVCVLGQ
jgi:hypothetical protein